MKTFTLLLASLLAAMLPGAKGFSAAPMTSFSTRRIASSTGTSALASSNAVFIRDVEKDESTYRYLLAQARECAFSDRAVTDPRDAKRYLMQILELESGCASGTLSGSDICNNIEELVDIVAHLRQKVEQPHVIVSSSDISAAVSMVVLVASSLTFAYLAEQKLLQQDAVPFTLEEWVWAAKGGYLNTMVAHFMRNGGL